jgi:hypothetical protein
MVRVTGGIINGQLGNMQRTMGNGQFGLRHRAPTLWRKRLKLWRHTVGEQVTGTFLCQTFEVYFERTMPKSA